MQTPITAIKNLVFEGGGVRGIAYAGALKALAEEGKLMEVERVGGSSAGAVCALFLALGYRPQEVEELFLTIKLKQFLDSDLGLLRDTTRLLTQFGWYKGEFFLDWISQIIEQKTGDRETTFAKLRYLKEKTGSLFKDLYVVGSNLNTGTAEVFSHENEHANMPIALAVRISISIPIFFKPIRIKNAYYVDGGVMRNYPITLFDNRKYNPTIPIQNIVPFNFETLGFRLDTKANIQRFLDPSTPNRLCKLKTFFHYTEALIGMISHVQDEAHLHSFDQNRTVYCDTLSIKSTDFRISREKRQALIDSGFHAVKSHFARLRSTEMSMPNFTEFTHPAIIQSVKGQHWIQLDRPNSSHHN